MATTGEGSFRISKQYTRLDTTLAAMVSHLATNAERLGVSTGQVAELTNFKTEWDTVFANYTSPSERNREAILAARNAYKKGDPLVRKIQQQVKNDAKVNLTANDRTSMGIHSDKTTRTRVQVVDTAPNIEEVKIHHRSNTFRISYPSGAGVSHLHMPYRNKALIKLAYMPPGSEGEPPPETYGSVRDSGRATFTVVHPNNIPKGTRGFVKVCYINSRGETGPDSHPLGFLVN